MKKLRMLAAFALALALALPGAVLLRAAEWNSDLTIYNKTNYAVVNGVTETTVAMRNADNENIIGHVATISKSSSATFKASYNKYYQSGSTKSSRKAAAANWSKWSMQSTTKQAAAYESASDTEGKVVLAINADYYDMTNGRPLGGLVCEGNELNAGSTNAEPYFAVLKDGSYVIREAGVSKADVLEAISGPFLLIKDGQIQEHLIVGNADIMPRQSIGIKANGDVVICEMDGRQEKSVGATYYQLAKYLKDQGCVNALYLDGGGSATFATKREGTDKLTVKNSPSDGSERSVSSALLLVYDASSDGKFDHASVTPVGEVYTPGFDVSFEAIGVDKSGSSAELPSDLSWQLASDSKAYGTIDAKTGKYTDNGKTTSAHTVTAQAVSGGKVVGSSAVTIAPPDEFRFTNDSLNLDYEEKSDLGLSVYYKGQELHYKAGDFDWTVEANEKQEKAGAMSGNTFTATANNEKGDLSVKSKVTVTSKWDSKVSASITVGVGTKPVVVMDGGDEDGLNYAKIPFTHAAADGGGIAYETYTDDHADANLIIAHYINGDGSSRGAKGSGEQVTVDTGKVRFGEKALKLNYDFTNITGIEGTCVGFVEDKVIEGSPTAVGIWVYAPEGTPNLWLRLRCIDGTGASQTLNFTERGDLATDGTKGGINWKGWKYITCDLSSVPGPITLRAGEVFRVMDTNGGQGDMGTWVCTKDDSGTVSEAKYVGHQKGYLYLDNMQFVYGNNPSDVDNPQITALRGGDLSNLQEIDKDGTTTFTSNTVSFYADYADVKNKYTSGIDFAYIYVDGVNLSENKKCVTNINDGNIRLNEMKLANGTHSVKILTRDKNGNEATVTRTFTVNGDNEGLTSVSLEKTEDTAYIGTDYELNLTSNKLEDVKKISTTIKIGTDTPVSEVEFSRGYAGTYEYDEETGLLTIKAERQDGATVSGDGTIAAISVKLPLTLKDPAYVSYQVEEGTITYAEAKSDEMLNTFATATTQIPVKAAYSVKVGVMLVGSANGTITVKDADGNPASGVKVYQSTDDGAVLLGKTKSDGVLTTDAFTDKVQEFMIYAKGKDGYSFCTSSKSAKAQGTEGNVPYNIIATATEDAATQKRLSWMSYPDSAKKRAIVQYAEKSAYDANGEKAFTSFEGTATLMDYLGSGDIENNFANYVNTATLTGLSAGTEYAYRVGDGTIWSSVSTFKTKKAGEDTNFFIIGDTQSNGEDLTNLKTIQEAINSKDYDFGVQLGDSLDESEIYDGWNNILKTFADFKSTDLLHVIGNHETYPDLDAKHANAIYNTPADAYYSVTYGNVYVATIAYTTERAQIKEAAEWLAKDAAASDAQWKMLVIHQPPYYTNPGGGSEYINEVIPPAADEGGIDFVFSGHDHSYARTYPLTKGDVAEDADTTKDIYGGKGVVYYICGSTGEKSYGVTKKEEFHFAKADQDFSHGIYLSVHATESECVVTTYDGDEVYDSFTKKKLCYNEESKQLEHTFTTYDAGKVICEKCGAAQDVETSKFSGLVKDKTTGKTMLFVNGKKQTGLSAYGEETLYFDEDGLGVTGDLKLGDTTYTFEDGTYKTSSDKDAGEVEFGFCGADADGKNLVYAYQKGNETLNIAKNPDIADASGAMKEWNATREVPWQNHRYTIETVNVAEGVTNIGHFFLRTELNPAAAQLKEQTSSLKTVNLPSTLTRISASAFFNASSLKKITIPASVTTVAHNAFAYGNNVEIKMLLDKIPTTYSSTFKDCSKDSVLYLWNKKAWRDAVDKKKIVFPGKIVWVGDDDSTSTEKKAETTTEKKTETTGTKKALYAKVKADSASKMTFSWNKISGASGYEIYLSVCGQSKKLVTKKNLVKTVKKGSTAKATVTLKKSLRKASYNYKAVVKAYKTVDGKKTYLATSLAMHFAGTSNKKYTNPKSVKLSKKKLTLKKGKSTTLKASVKKENGKKKLLSQSHDRKIRWYSSNTEIASVDKKSGKIMAKKKGNCTIYAVALNGVKTSVKVTVK